MIQIAIGYYIIIQLIGLIAMRVDKRRAMKNNKRRIPEKNLWTIAWLGGAAGLLIGMRKYRHKTKKNVFRIGLPMLTVIHIALIFYLAYTFQ